MEHEIKPEQTWVGYEGASEYCGLKRTTLWKLCCSNKIISAKEGSRVLINLPSLDAYLHNKARKGSVDSIDADGFDNEYAGS
jgi:hypothetical protein